MSALLQRFYDAVTRLKEIGSDTVLETPEHFDALADYTEALAACVDAADTDEGSRLLVEGLEKLGLKPAGSGDAYVGVWKTTAMEAALRRRYGVPPRGKP